MTWRTCAFVSSMLVAAAVLVAQSPQTSQPVFRTATDLVSVDVGVKSDGTPVGDLKASDFVVLDNGVPQHVEIVEMETVPVDVTILVETTEDIGPYMGSLNEQLQKIAALVRPDDRVRVLTIDTYVTDILPLQRAAGHAPFAQLTSRGLSSAHDALAAALMRADPNRPNLVIALTDSIDSISTLSSETVREIARQSNATLHISWVTMFKEPMSPDWYSVAERTPHAFQQGSGVPTHRSWKPYNEPPSKRTTHDFKLLREAADLTGGKLHEPGIFTEVTASAVFKHAFEDVRRSYLLRYTPQGVPREGWHDIKVTIPAHKGFTINARRGYAIDTGGASRVAPSAPAPRVEATAPSIDGISDHVKLIHDFRAGGNPWPLAPHREAAFVLELAHGGFFDQDYAARDAARQMLAWYGKLVRHPLGPNAFEHDWLSAELQLLEGANQPAMALPFVEKALARFPGEPRFLLADAILTDQLTATDRLDAGSPRMTALIAKYNAAIQHDETRAEARVREAWLLHRLGRDAEALSMLDPGGDRAPDATVESLRQWIRSQIQGAISSEPGSWTLYWQGDYRLYSGTMARLRLQ